MTEKMGKLEKTITAIVLAVVIAGIVIPVLFLAGCFNIETPAIKVNYTKAVEIVKDQTLLPEESVKNEYLGEKTKVVLYSEKGTGLYDIRKGNCRIEGYKIGSLTYMSLSYAAEKDGKEKQEYIDSLGEKKGEVSSADVYLKEITKDVQNEADKRYDMYFITEDTVCIVSGIAIRSNTEVPGGEDGVTADSYTGLTDEDAVILFRNITRG